MELKIVQEGQWKPAALGGRNESSIHADILALGGRETEVTWEDVFDGMFTFLFYRPSSWYCWRFKIVDWEVSLLGHIITGMHSSLSMHSGFLDFHFLCSPPMRKTSNRFLCLL